MAFESLKAMPLLNQLPKGPHYGLLAQFATPADLYHACERVRDAGFTRWDAHTPFPVHVERSKRVDELRDAKETQRPSFERPS